MTHDEDEKMLAALREQEAALAMKAKGARSPHVGRCHERRLARVQHFSSKWRCNTTYGARSHITVPPSYLERIGPASA